MTVIKVENLSKQYKLGYVNSLTLKDDLKVWWHELRGKENPLLKVGETNDRTQKGESDYVWSLRDINFEVQQGEVLGIIGRNGAGKSTLLKILSKVTGPTTGSIKIKGRVASLLEVGTGFNPELTGRENIYLNGAILGMRKQEIDAKFDEIVAFSGVEKYIDTPVKRYSSGMYVRLAFAVAAHLEPEILIVDEVLAVGDAEFQKKCLGKMKDVSSQGRTVLFVSHNMTAVKSLCQKGLYLNNGKIELHSGIDEVMADYLKTNNMTSVNEVNFASNKIIIHSIYIDDNGVPGNFNIDEPLLLTVNFKAIDLKMLTNFNLFFKTTEGQIIFATCSSAQMYSIGDYTIQCEVPKSTLNDNEYALDFMMVENGEKATVILNDILTIKGNEPKRESAWLTKFPGLIRPEYFKWNIKKN
jgi:lipopolysaccharide transport system ATP-binding protein